MSPAEERRLALIRWMRERPEHDGWPERDIAELSGIYTGYGAHDRCYRDLRVLKDRRVVTRQHGRPQRWWLR